MKASRWLLASCVVGSWGCHAREAPPPYEFVVHATSDPERPLGGVVFSYDDQPIGITKPDGTLRLAIHGQEGEVYAVSVACPDAYQSPRSRLEIPLRRGSDTAKSPEYWVSCPPKSRSVVVAVRADNGRNLPVYHLGREVARTDASGAAHVLIEAAPGEQFELTLGTQGPGGEHLRPQNPAMKFAVKNQDELFTFDQRFIIDAPQTQAALRPSRPTPLR